MGDQTVNWNPLAEQAADIRNYANQDITNQLQKIKSLRAKCTWEGAAGEESLQGFDSFMNEMEKLPTALDKFGNFLDKVAGTYAETSNAVRNTFNNQVYNQKM